MTQSGEKRKLTTILAIDVAGYSAQSEENQARAIAYVAALRQRASQLAEADGGHIFNTAGDGLMLEFPLASGGVRTAVALVREAVSDPKRLPRIRAGVHLGEVVIDGNDRLGHGVNVAARLMQMAPPNAVVISEAVQSQLHGEIDAVFSPCGRVRLKKMRETILAFEYLPSASAARLQWRRWRKPLLVASVVAAIAMLGFGGVRVLGGGQTQTPFVAVLRFDNLSSDPALAYFSDGISTEIQSTLAQYQDGIRVAGLTTGFQFHGPDKNPTHVRQAMGATHIVDGSVRREGDAVRIVAELVDTRTGSVLWTETYDRAISGALDAQADIAKRIGSLLHLTTPEIAAPPAQMPPAALEHYLQAVDLLNSSTSPDIDQAAHELEDATAAAPHFSRAWALLSSAYASQSRRRNEADQAVLIEKAHAAAQRAIALDPRSSLGEAMLGRTEPEWNWQARRQHYLRALALAPNDVNVLMYWGDFLRRTGRLRDQAEIARQIERLDPLSQGAQGDLIGQLLNAHDPAGAMREATRLTALDERSADVWWPIMDDRENANDLPGARRALHELELHWSAISRDHRFSQQQADQQMAEFHRDLETLKHGPPSEAEIRRIGQSYYNRVTGPNLGQGCVADMIPYVASLDRPDLAWTMIETLYIDKGYVGTTDTCARPLYPSRQAATWPLFTIGLIAEQRDRRIWRTFDAVGLTRYWRETNEWPDFCSEPNFPYDCKAVAAEQR
jgi:TolB-like protein/class 3 adenylate cyclase